MQSCLQYMEQRCHSVTENRRGAVINIYIYNAVSVVTPGVEPHDTASRNTTKTHNPRWSCTERTETKHEEKNTGYKVYSNKNLNR